MRNNSWLTARLKQLYRQHFDDVNLPNIILVRFGRRAKSRLGSITLKKLAHRSGKVSVITINGLLKDESVPEMVIDAVLAHELVHYCHGFSSELPRLYRYPHQSGIVDRELIKRGLGKLLAAEKSWTKQNFASLYNQ